jgi:hypothetical protein
LSFHRGRRAWRIVDTVAGTSVHAVVWRLHLTPGLVFVDRIDPDRTLVVFEGTPAVHLLLRCPEEMTVRIVESPMSNSYGSMSQRPVIEIAGSVRLPLRISCVIRAEGPQDRLA